MATLHAEHPWPHARAEQWIGILMDRDASVQIRNFAYHRIEPGWFVGPMAVPEHLVWIVTEGRCVGTIAEKPCTLRTGTLLIIPPRTTFAMRLADESVPNQMHRFRLAVQHRRRTVAIAPCPLQVEQAWPLQPSIDQIIEEAQLDRPHREARLRALLTVLFSELARMVGDVGNQQRRLNEAQCRELIRLTTECAADHPTPTELARTVGLSPDYFTRLFTATFGMPPRRWLMEQRIREAALRLSESSLNITQVARALGYSDVFLFSRQFKQVMGQSPRAYRAADRH